jgi:hypothetical protein
VRVRDDWTSQPTELNVIFELVGFSIQRGGHSSSTRAVLGVWQRFDTNLAIFPQLIRYKDVIDSLVSSEKES